VAPATLVLEGASSWDRSEVSLVALRNTASVPVQFVPSEINKAAEPGEVLTPFVTASAPEMATVLPVLVGGLTSTSSTTRPT
jgi:hypothetical protein